MKTLQITRFALLALLAALLAACCPCRRLQRLYGAPLEQTRWQLVQLDGREIRPAPDAYTLTFDKKGTFGGRGGCNAYHGSYTAEKGGRLQIDGVASTRMACHDDGVENGFFRALREATRYELDAKMLILSTGEEVRAILQATEEPENADSDTVRSR